MKVIVSKLDTRYHGIVKALKQCEEVIEWDHKKPAYDLFDEVVPDAVWFDSDLVDRAFINCLKEFKPKTVLFGDKVDVDIEPDLVCSQPNISPVMRKHLEASYKAIFLHDYADIVTYRGGKADPIFECDFGYISKSTNNISEVAQILLTLGLEHNVKVVGPIRVPIPQYLGSIKVEREMDFLRSCKVAIDSDSNLLNQVANGIFTMSLIPTSLVPMLHGLTHEDSLEILANEAPRRALATVAQQKILVNDTCYHRLYEICGAADMKFTAGKASKLLEEWK